MKREERGSLLFSSFPRICVSSFPFCHNLFSFLYFSFFSSFRRAPSLLFAFSALLVRLFISSFFPSLTLCVFPFSQRWAAFVYFYPPALVNCSCTFVALLAFSSRACPLDACRLTHAAAEAAPPLSTPRSRKRRSGTDAAGEYVDTVESECRERVISVAACTSCAISICSYFPCAQASLEALRSATCGRRVGKVTPKRPTVLTPAASAARRRPQQALSLTTMAPARTRLCVCVFCWHCVQLGSVTVHTCTHVGLPLI